MLLKKTSFFIIACTLALFLFNRIFFFQPGFLENAAATITYPALWLTHAIVTPIKNLTLKRRALNEALERNIVLKIEHEKLQQENIKLKALLNYDAMSLELREFASRYILNDAVLAKILAKTLSDEEHTLVINRGERDGISCNMVAIYQNQLVGRVTNVYPYHSKIQLITDSQSKVSAYVTTPSAAGIVHGTNDVKFCCLNYVSHLSKVSRDDLVLSSGKGLVFPQGFCLGRVSNVKTTNISQEIELTPLVDLQSLEMCLLTNQSKMNIF